MILGAKLLLLPLDQVKLKAFMQTLKRKVKKSKSSLKLWYKETTQLGREDKSIIMNLLSTPYYPHLDLYISVADFKSISINIYFLTKCIRAALKHSMFLLLKLVLLYRFLKEKIGVFGKSISSNFLNEFFHIKI